MFLTQVTQYLKSQKRESKKIAMYIFFALTIRWGLAEAYRIPSESMNPTLKPGDHIMVNKAQYGVRIPFTKTTILETGAVKRGDVVVFRFPQDESIFYVKRVVGLPGEIVLLDEKGQLFINGQKQNETYVSVFQSQIPAPNAFGPVTVPDGQLFVLGDNRFNSADSRVWGFLPKQNVLGKVAFKWFSWIE